MKPDATAGPAFAALTPATAAAAAEDAKVVELSQRCDMGGSSEFIDDVREWFTLPWDCNT